MSADTDWIAASWDPRVRAAVLARDWLVVATIDGATYDFTQDDLRRYYGSSVTEDQTCDLLEAVDAWEAVRGSRSGNLDAFREDLDNAVAAVVGERL